jgi:hypothetical protein
MKVVERVEGGVGRVGGVGADREREDWVGEWGERRGAG